MCHPYITPFVRRLTKEECHQGSVKYLKIQIEISTHYVQVNKRKRMFNSNNLGGHTCN